MLSVVIPTCNRNELLGKCLDQLYPGAQTASVQLYEVIVTDDSKENIAKSFIEKNYAWAKWVEGKKKGPAANRNNGAKYAHAEWLVFIDDDCVPGSDLIMSYCEALRIYKNVNVFEGYITADRIQRNLMEESPINTTGGFLWSCNFMIKKDFFENVLKGFDESYPFAAMEDVDLHYRIKKMNEPVQFLDCARVIHPWRVQNKPLATGNKRFSSLIYFVNKFPEKQKEYNTIYFLRAFINMNKELLKNAARFRFRGFSKRIIVVFMQLYFAFRILLLGLTFGATSQSKHS